MEHNNKTKKDFLTPRGRALVEAIREAEAEGRELFPTPFCRVYLDSVSNRLVERAKERKKRREEKLNTEN